MQTTCQLKDPFLQNIKNPQPMEYPVDKDIKWISFSDYGFEKSCSRIVIKLTNA